MLTGLTFVRSLTPCGDEYFLRICDLADTQGSRTPPASLPQMNEGIEQLQGKSAVGKG